MNYCNRHDSKQPNPVYKELLGVLIKNNHKASLTTKNIISEQSRKNCTSVLYTTVTE